MKCQHTVRKAPWGLARQAYSVSETEEIAA